jgi:ribonuclease HII
VNAGECIENALYATHPTRYILGCDEVGRGPLAGPVTAACVVFPLALQGDFPLFAELNDSKKLSAKKRVSLVPEIEAAAAAFAVVDLSPQEIDRLNILQASLTAMRMAVNNVVKTLQDKALLPLHGTKKVVRRSLFDQDSSQDADQFGIFVVVDGNKTIPELVYPQEAYIKGDARSWSIAAASILAKVHRDSLMVEYDKIYPGYGFAKHAGYPTKFHRDAIEKLGLSPIHRRSFHLH